MGSTHSVSTLEWKDFIDNFPDHIARFGEDFKHIYINRAIENEIQMSSSLVIGKSNRDLRIPDNDKALDELENCIKHVFETGTPTIYYTQHTYPSGTKFYYMKLIPGFIKGTRQVESVWAITREITPLKEAERKLRKSRRMLIKKNQELDFLNANLDTFFYTVSHDLRNPIANLKSIVSLLKRESDEKVKDYINLLDKSANRLDNILSGLTELIRQTGSKEIKSKWDFDTILWLLKTEYDDQLIEVSGQITSDFSSCSDIFYIRPYLESIFRNMISNSIKYRRPDQPLHIHISTNKEGSHIVIVFKDNGIGINLQKIGHKLFKPFYQVDQKKEGTGMGLHIVKNIVEKNGGKIEVTSQLNMGTTFKVYLMEY